MSKNRVKIVADSSCDTPALSGVSFETAALKIITADREYVDDAALDVRQMVEDLQHYKGKSSTSCPNANDWLQAFGDAEQVFCVTITGTLSGSYNAACMAKELYEAQYPGRRVFVLNSLTAGPEIVLLLEKLQELIAQGRAFEDICEAVTKYSRCTGLLFMLESMKNLANNGRVSPLTAKMAGLLGIRVVGKASERGDLEPLSKCRGEQKALEAIVQYLKSLKCNGGKVRIAHCFNEGAGQQLKKLISTAFEKVQVELYNCRGLCSFYAEKGGILIGFEKEAHATA